MSRKITQAEYIENFRYQMGMNGVQKAFIELINNEWQYDRKVRAGARPKILKLVSQHLKKYCKSLNYTQNWNGYVFTNNLGYALERDFIRTAINYDYGGFELVVEGEPIVYLNFKNDAERSKYLVENWAKEQGYY